MLKPVVLSMQKQPRSLCHLHPPSLHTSDRVNTRTFARCWGRLLTSSKARPVAKETTACTWYDWRWQWKEPAATMTNLSKRLCKSPHNGSCQVVGAKAFRPVYPDTHNPIRTTRCPELSLSGSASQTCKWFFFTALMSPRHG